MGYITVYGIKAKPEKPMAPSEYWSKAPAAADYVVVLKGSATVTVCLLCTCSRPGVLSSGISWTQDLFDWMDLWSDPVWQFLCSQQKFDPLKPIKFFLLI